MKEERLEVLRGSGNVFRDLGDENADVEDVEQFKAILAAEIIKARDRQKLSCALHRGVPGLRRPTSRASQCGTGALHCRSSSSIAAPSGASERRSASQWKGGRPSWS